MTKKSPYIACDVAKYIIYLASKDLIGENKEREGVTNLKLQKILYFAQAYYLAKLKKPLFSDEITAWAYGPVVPNVYHAYKNHKNNPITADEDKSSISKEDKLIIQEVWNTFGGYSASRLVDIAHSHAPWKEAFKTTSQIITKDALSKYYVPLFNK
ncbi:MAG TPA: DUF4065 domain-containing protein [Candidatus Paceibacterota bacterium]|nr:DUF4065 domain-containing protein [Candidatus Paceibacterota bacterium]